MQASLDVLTLESALFLYSTLTNFMHIFFDTLALQPTLQARLCVLTHKSALFLCSALTYCMHDFVYFAPWPCSQPTTCCAHTTWRSSWEINVNTHTAWTSCTSFPLGDDMCVRAPTVLVCDCTFPLPCSLPTCCSRATWRSSWVMWGWHAS